MEGIHGLMDLKSQPKCSPYQKGDIVMIHVSSEKQKTYFKFLNPEFMVKWYVLSLKVVIFVSTFFV